MKKTSFKALLGAGASALALTAVAPANAADLDIEPDKEYVEVCPNSGFRGAILLPGTGVCFKVGGYAKADFIFRFDDFAGTNGTFSGANASATAFGFGAQAGAGGNRSRFHANQSRINFDARTTTDLGSARAFVEGDFAFNGFSNTQTFANRSQFTLRHAFVELGIDSLGGSLVAGQNWSLFTDFNVYPNTLDFNGPPTQAFLRQAQIRWTQPLSDAFTFAISAENPVTFVAGANLGVDAVPDFIAALSYSSGALSGRLSGVVTYQDPNNAAVLGATTTDTALGWAVQASLRLAIGDRDSLTVQGIYGDGHGRYQFTGVASGAVNSLGTIQTLRQYGGIVHGQHFWSDKLNSSAWFAYARALAENDTVTGARLVANTGTQIYTGANLVYNIRSNIIVGLEGLYTIVTDDVTGVDNDNFSLQTSFQFSF